MSDATAANWVDPVIEAYKRDVDRTLLREALKMTPEERLANLQRLCEFAEEIQRAGRKSRAQQ
ncbi:MAG: hypothetical protein ABR915_16810 [Thermoguttaceae bacterium]|jgi:hypothetical protein